MSQEQFDYESGVALQAEYEYQHEYKMPCMVKYQLHSDFRGQVEQLPRCKAVKCIYCNEGPTDKDDILVRVYAPGTYFQHWSWDGKGCKANIDNKNPLGEIVENKKNMKDLQTILNQQPVYMHKWKTRMDVIRDFEDIPLLETDHENALLWIMTNVDLSTGNSQMITALEKWKNINILFASYECESYDGDAFVLFEREGKLYEVNASHCSCYGLEGQFEPGVTTLEALRYRLTKGTLGIDRIADVFATRLKWFLGIPTE